MLDQGHRRIVLPAPDGVTTMRAALDRLDHAGVAGWRYRPAAPVARRRLPCASRDARPRETGRPDSDRDIRGQRKGGPGLDVLQRPPASSDVARSGQPSPQPIPREPRGSLFRDAWVITKRNLLRISANTATAPRSRRSSRFSSCSCSAMCSVGSIQIPNTSYIDYLIPGIFVTATLMGATTAVAIAGDISGGMIDRYRSLPMARSAVLAGRCVADLLRSLLVVAIVLVVGLLLGFRFHNGALGAVAALAMVFAAGFAFIWVFALIGLVVKDPETAQLAGFLPVMPFIFASTVFVRAREHAWLAADLRPESASLPGRGQRPCALRGWPRRRFRVAHSRPGSSA